MDECNIIIIHTNIDASIYEKKEKRDNIMSDRLDSIQSPFVIIKWKEDLHNIMIVSCRPIFMHV